MQPLISAMTTLRQAFAAALKSLLRGKTLIQAFLAFWVSPTVLKSQKAEPRDQPTRTIEDFLKEAQALLVGPSEGDGLRDFASKLKVQFRKALLSNPDCMLPSYNYQLPSGYERGQYLALDVGGSTLRVALVELRSRGARGSESGIIRMKSFPIDSSIKLLEGMDFFNWMADLILETVAEDVKQNSSEKPLPMGLAWSFPIEYVSIFPFSSSAVWQTLSRPVRQSSALQIPKTRISLLTRTAGKLHSRVVFCAIWARAFLQQTDYLVRSSETLFSLRARGRDWMSSLLQS
jgi:hexokinase